MTTWKLFAVVAPLALSSAAFAAPAHMTDAQYIAAGRCAGLMSSAALGRQDTRSIEARLKSEGVSRSVDVLDRADEARESAMRSASHAGAYGKQGLIAERDSACAAFAPGPMAAAAPAANASRVN
jgi:hypothetical protein